MIRFKLETNGAFIAGDTETGRTVYAYPSSTHATQAKWHPKTVAAKMMTAENSAGKWRDAFDDYDLRNWTRINAWLERIAACLEVSDLEIMEANGAGIDAYSDGKSVHDNPYQQKDLRNAWHEGWRCAELHRED